MAHVSHPLTSTAATSPTIVEPQNTSQTKIYHPLPSTLAHTIPHLSLPRQHPQPTPPPTNLRHARLQSQIRTLQSQISKTKTTLSSTITELRNILPPPPPSSSAARDPSTTLSDDTTLARAKELVKNHIRLLHRYNEIKDVGMGLMGLIADRDGRRIGDVMEEFGVEEAD